VRIPKGSYLQRGEDRTCDPILTNEVFHAISVILRLKLGNLFIYGWLMKRILLLFLSAILIQIPIHEFLSPVPVYCRVQSGTAWFCLAATGGMPAPVACSTRKLSIHLAYVALFHLVLLILLVLLVLLVLIFNV